MAAHCTGCGAASTECGGCNPSLDPPRFCAECGRRLAVAVSPGSWRARCATHGITTGSHRLEER